MPKTAAPSQIQKIYLLGSRVCGQCDIVLGNLAKKGLVAEKQIIDPDNPVHQKFRDMAVRNGDTSAPIIYTEDATGSLKYIGAGVAFIHVLRLAAIEKDLQEARQKELVDA
ncbi:MAG TPA: hypothetical protein VGO98_02540 [Candidatus Saccharimonadales bacterium]|jgi:hypothetical protein|nr:hypothetical protein [Candidatus Saccharimonadales bacterium]